MVIGEDMALRINDHSCPQPFEFPFELAGHAGISEKATEERVVFKRQQRILDFLAFGDFDMHHSRNILLRDLDNRCGQIFCQDRKG